MDKRRKDDLITYWGGAGKDVKPTVIEQVELATERIRRWLYLLGDGQQVLEEQFVEDIQLLVHGSISYLREQGIEPLDSMNLLRDLTNDTVMV